MKKLRNINALLAIALVMSMIVSVQPAAAKTAAPALAAEHALYVPGEVVVGFTGGGSAEVYAQRAMVVAQNVKAQVVKQEGNAALLSFSADADVPSLIGQVKAQRGVAYAEPNYIYANPTPAAVPFRTDAFSQNVVLRRSAGALHAGGAPRRGAAPAGALSASATLAPVSGEAEMTAISIEALRSMRKKTAGGIIKAVYPNDPYAWWGGGWDWVGASIVWPNTTASAGICEIDTGVDYLHPDLTTRIVKGYDFVNADADPMDDNGHGTHVAGIMAANRNNLKGLSGVSTGKVVAVKALDAQGFGTNFDVAAAITYCANRSDVRVINMSLGGPVSTTIQNAVAYAVNTAASPKLIVAAAGNGDTNVTTNAYPAAYNATYPDKVLAVAASGYWFQHDPVNAPDDWWVDNSCRGGYYDPDTNTAVRYSNYGAWIDVVAPGAVYSTTPWDKPFWMNTYEDTPTRYAWMDGTSMAAPFVAATAARRWGYKSTRTNAQIGGDVIASGDVIHSNAEGGWFIDMSDYTGDSDPGTDQLRDCWPAGSGMGTVRYANVAAMLERGAVGADAFDAVTGLPLNGASMIAMRWNYITNTGASVGTGVITPDTWKADPYDTDPTRIYTSYNQWTDVINLPVDVLKSTATAPYDCNNNTDYDTLTWSMVSKSGYTATPQWTEYYDCVSPGRWGGMGRANVPPKSANFDIVTSWWIWQTVTDLDSLLWLPGCTSAPCTYQANNFLVGAKYGDDFGTSEGDTTGAMTGFPFARLKRDGGTPDDLRRVETISIRNRYASHDGLAANAALPYYPGKYVLQVTDWPQTNDGADAAVMGTADAMPWVFVWKDGVIKSQAWPDTVIWDGDGDICTAKHFWKAMTIDSGPTGVVTYWPPTNPNWYQSKLCGDTMYSSEPPVP